MSLEEVINEVNNHDIKAFEILSLESDPVQKALEYLRSTGREEMAEHLKTIALNNGIRMGPVQGFLAAALDIQDKEIIILSDKYDEYNTVHERSVSLVHEIGATKPFKQSDDENEILSFGMNKWLVEQAKEEVTEQPVKEEPVIEEVKEEIKEEEPVKQVEEVQEPKEVPVAEEKETQETVEDTEEEPVKEPPAPEVKRAPTRSLIDTLILKDAITKEQLDDAKDKQVGAKKPLQELFVSMGFVEEQKLMDIAHEVFNLPIIELKDENIDTNAIHYLSNELAIRHGVFPLRAEESELILAMSNPQDVLALDDIRALVDMPIKPILCAPSDIKKYIEERYESDDGVYDLLNNSTDEAEVEVVKENAEELIDGMDQENIPDLDKAEEADLPPQYKALLQDESPTVKLMNLILSDAVKVKASDIHFEPKDKIIEIRYRIDGDLKTILKIPTKFYKKMVVRMKILAGMDITEQVEPQDGRVQLTINKHGVDFRVSTIPTFYGEKIVARVLDASEAKTDLELIGFSKIEKEIFESAIKAPQGMVFVTGPTGSGKTSTLYAAINYIKGETTNIITVEDPIEFVNEGVNQIQVNPLRGVTFASALRSILRQDPNVILIGEIRDKETADIAVKASLTGHLVLSTLHTNSSIETISRLADIGLDYYQIASSVILVVSQRLIKTICPNCKEEYEPNENYKVLFKNEIEKYSLKTFYKGAGCQECNFSGYRGRAAVFEMLKMNQKLKDIISSEPTQESLRDEAEKQDSYRTLVDSGLDKVKAGITTLDEVAKHLGTLEDGAIEKESTEGDEEEVEDVRTQREKPLVLAVDDEADILKIIAKYLELGGYDIVLAKNGQEGVEAAFREKPDLVVTDIMMPVMNGFELTKKLRSSLETAVIPIMMLTAKQDKESELKGLDVGADDYLTKPFDKDKLLARVKILLNRK